MKIFRIKHRAMSKSNRFNDVIRISSWTCFQTSLNIVWKMFSDSTSFHGMKYLASEKKFHQKSFWLICLAVSSACLSVLAHFLYLHYMIAPTKTIVKSQHFPSTLIPFPAITVCSPTKLSVSKVKTFLRPFLRYYEDTTNISTDENAIFRATSKINDPLEDNFVSDEDMKQLDKILEFGKFSVTDFVEEMSFECNDWLIKCVWNSKDVPCAEIFKRILTSEGYFCSFNYEGVHLKKYSSVYSIGFNLYSGLSMAIASSAQSSSIRNNIRVLIHDPFTYPKNIKTDFLVARDMETAISMRIIYSLAEYQLRELSPKTRNCVFRDEYHLEYFSAYTFENCITECQIRRYYQLCGCVPHFFEINGRKVCKATEISCIVHYSTQILVHESSNETSACICPNECDMFLIKTSLSEWKFHPMNETVVKLYRGLSRQSTIIHIYFGQSHNLLFNKILSLSGINFTSNIGGLISLFLGCSLISILEIFYYFVYRLYRNYKQIRMDSMVLFVNTNAYLEFNRKYWNRF